MTTPYFFVPRESTSRLSRTDDPGGGVVFVCSVVVSVSLGRFREYSCAKRTVGGWSVVVRCVVAIVNHSEWLVRLGKEGSLACEKKEVIGAVQGVCLSEPFNMPQTHF